MRIAVFSDMHGNYVALDVDALIAVYHASGRPFADEAIAQYQ